MKKKRLNPKCSCGTRHRTSATRTACLRKRKSAQKRYQSRYPNTFGRRDAVATSRTRRRPVKRRATRRKSRRDFGGSFGLFPLGLIAGSRTRKRRPAKKKRSARDKGWWKEPKRHAKAARKGWRKAPKRRAARRK